MKKGNTFAVAASAAVLVATVALGVKSKSPVAPVPAGSTAVCTSFDKTRTYPCFPDPTLTPGVIAVTDINKLPLHTSDVRHTSEATKDAVYAEYGITHRDPGEFEIDHRLSLGASGGDDKRNLWAQAYNMFDPNGNNVGAHTKDRVEDYVINHLRDRTMTLADGQAAFLKSPDWTWAYIKYIGPLPKTVLK